MRIDLPMIEFFGRGGLSQSPAGTATASLLCDFPMLIDLYLQGQARLGSFRVRDHHARRRRGGLPSNGARRGPALGRGHRLVIDHVTTSGTFTLDGQDFNVENNVWLIGDDTEVLGDRRRP